MQKESFKTFLRIAKWTSGVVLALAILWFLLVLAVDYFTLQILNPGALSSRSSRSMELIELHLVPSNVTMSKTPRAEMEKHGVQPSKYRIPKAYLEYVTNWDSVLQSRIRLRYNRKTLQPTTFDPPIGPTDPKLDDQISLVLRMGLTRGDFEALKQSKISNRYCKKVQSEHKDFEKFEQYFSNEAAAREHHISGSFAQYYFHSMPDSRFGLYIACAQATEYCTLYDWRDQQARLEFNISRSAIGKWRAALTDADNFVQSFAATSD